MGDRYKIDKKIKLLWMLPYIGVIFLVWIGVTTVLFIANDQFPLFKDMPPLILSVLFLFFLILVIGLPAYIWNTLKYNAFFYEIGDNNFIITEGVISKKQTVIPYDTLEDVGVKRSLIEQAIGLSTLELDTAGSSDIEGFVPGISDPDYVMGIIKSKMSVGSKKNNNENTMSQILSELKEIKNILKGTVEEKSTERLKYNKDIEKQSMGFQEPYEDRISKLEKIIKKKFEKTRKDKR
ncbi:PH domain-containing protein [Candidatus Micrarchaeota archaeon]|nr:PH domain-containing protein [Candidatus Micrarchaeota archaeon]